MTPPSLSSALSRGLTGASSAVVGPQDTSRAAGAGDLEVLATARILALLEAAAVDAVDAALEPELTTIGVRVELEHLLPVAVAATVRASASLLSVRGRRLVFGVKLHDGQERAIAVGRLTRAVVERAAYGELIA